MILRRWRRAVALIFSLSACILRYWRIRWAGALTLEQRALWMQAAARSVAASLNIQVHVEGRPPARGLLVANHLSYFDIVALSSAVPCAFVARADLDRWPLFGGLARRGGTIFLNRSSLASANAAAGEMAARFHRPIPVILFPEATSTDGTEMLRFHSRLFHPATESGTPITAVAIRYVVDDGPDGPHAEREVCFYGDDVLMSHMWKALGLPRFTAHLRFGEARVYSDAREAADETRGEIAALRAESAPVLVESGI